MKISKMGRQRKPKLQNSVFEKAVNRLATAEKDTCEGSIENIRIVQWAKQARVI